MKLPKITRAVGQIDGDLVDSAENSARAQKKRAWIKWSSVAACFAVLAVCTAVILPQLLRDDDGDAHNNRPTTEQSGASDENGGKYKDILIQTESSAIVWAWKDLTTYEKYTLLKLDGIEYSGSRRSIAKELVGELIGTYAIDGYDPISFTQDGYYTEQFEVYSLKYADKSRFVAAKMDGEYYVFKKDTYDPPSTLGELFEQVELSEAIELSRFSEGGDGPDGKHYMLKDDAYIWEIIGGCKDASFVKDDSWRRTEREYLSFSVTSQTLGVYRVAMYITADGYLWTNAFDYQYLFNIGSDAAGKIIKYAKENSSKADYEPYRSSVCGKVVEINEEYLVIDDTELCKDPADASTYRVPLGDKRISRYVTNGVIKVGNTVQVSYEGEIDGENGNTVGSAVDISKAIFSGGEVLIPE